MAAQEIVIEFSIDYSGLDKAIDTMEKLGQLDAKVAQEYRRTTAEVNRQSQAIKNSAAAYKGPIQSIEQLDKKSKQFVRDFISGIQEGINEELKRAKPEIDALRKKIEEAGKLGTASTQSLRQELRNLTEQIAAAKASGGPIDANMIKRAGELKDAISDANAEIKNAGSDTRGIDNVVGSISALAGGFSAVQGAVGLFTDENEELQKVLLKVNSAMALATGIQQVANAVTKEGSLTKLADSAASATQVAIQKIYTAVTGRATAATVGFKVALAATGIGLFLIGILAVVEGLKSFAKASDDAAVSQERLAAEIQAVNDLLEGETAIYANQEKLETALAKRRGANAEQLFQIEQKYRRLRAQAIVDALAELSDLNTEGARKLQQELEDLNTEGQAAEIDHQTELIEIRKKAAEKQRQEAREARLRELEDFKAGIEIQLLAVEKGSEEELQLKKKLANAELLIDLEGQKKTLAQKRLAIKQYFKDIDQLDIDNNKKSIANAAENERLRLEGELNNLNVSNEEKLALNISLLDVVADQERQSAEGNAAKIRAIIYRAPSIM